MTGAAQDAGQRTGSATSTSNDKQHVAPLLQALIPSTTVAGLLYYLGATRNDEYLRYFLGSKFDASGGIVQTPIQTMTQSVDVLVSISLVIVGVLVVFALASGIGEALTNEALPRRTRRSIALVSLSAYAVLVAGLLLYGLNSADNYAPLAVPACGGVTAAVGVVALKAVARSARVGGWIGYLDSTAAKLLRIAAWILLGVALVATMRNYAAYIGRADAESVSRKPDLLSTVTLRSKETLPIPGGSPEAPSDSVAIAKAADHVIYIYPPYRKLAEAGDKWYLISTTWTPGDEVYAITYSSAFGAAYP